MGEIVKPLDPNDFKVVKIYSFTDPITNKLGTVGYQRPLTSFYNQNHTDDFDKMFVTWLNDLNLKNVQMKTNCDVMFEGQLDKLRRIYDGGRPQSKLFITARGNYTNEELMKIGQINGYRLSLPIYWNTQDSDRLIDEGGVFTFDKNQENYFFEVLKSLKVF